VQQTGRGAAGGARDGEAQAQAQLGRRDKETDDRQRKA
jgi:hypothetical protein